MDDVILHQWRISPFCGKVRRCLEFKGISYRTIESYNGLKSLAAAKLSTEGTLPILDIDGRRLVDSTRIARYLDEHHAGPRLFPEAPEQAALAQVWDDWADEVLFWMEVYLRVSDKTVARQTAALLSEGRPGWEAKVLAPMFRLVYGKRCRDQGLARSEHAEVMQRFEQHLGLIDASLCNKPWLLGEQRSIADIAVCSQLHEIRRTSVEAYRMEAYPELTRWLAATEALIES